MRLTAAILLGMILAGAAQAAPELEAMSKSLPAKAEYAYTVIYGRYSVDKAVNDASKRLAGETVEPVKTIAEFQWPGIYIESEFSGTEVMIRFSNDTDAFTVAVDDDESIKISKPGDDLYRLSGLVNGWHRLRIEKTNESQATVGTFDQVWAAPGEKTRLPVSRSKNIEFIGDSYTVGYGNTAGKRECTKDEIWATTDTSQAFGPLTAKHYNADYQINAFSGRGVVRNYDGFAGDTLPGLYPYALFDGKTVYNDPTWQPQVIVIALGTNDFSTPVHAGEKWKTQEDLTNDYETTYVAFVKSLRVKNPNATILLISYDPATSPAISTVRDRLKADGDSKIDFIEITGFTKNACDYHPDTNDDSKISNALISWFDAHPDIWQGK